MIDFLHDLRTAVRPVDLLDMAVIALFLYFLLVWLTRRASRSVVLALLIAGTLYVVAWRLEMYLTQVLFQVGFTVIALALVVVFQEDIRRGFERLAAWSRSGGREADGTTTTDVLVESVSHLAREQMGALIVLKGRESLDRHLRGGVPVDGALSPPLLRSIFDFHSPGHDGAVLVEDGRISRFGVHLPLSANLEAVGSAGTRHAAALGLAERSDALVVVVSEERGTISIAHAGRLEPVASGAVLKERLERFHERFSPDREATGVRRRRLVRNLGPMAGSVALSVMLWMLFVWPAEVVQRSYTVPIEYRNLPPNWELEHPRPTEVRVTLSGSQRAFDRLAPAELVVSLDMSRVREGPQHVVLTEDDVRRTAGLAVTEIEPRVVPVEAYRLWLAELPVRVRTTGRPSEGLRITAAEPDPSRIRVLLRESDRGIVREIETAPIELGEQTESGTVRAPLLPPDQARFVDPEDSTVDVAITLAPEEDAAEQ